MKQTALILTLLLLLSLTFGASAAEQKAAQMNQQESLFPLDKELQAQSGAEMMILAQTNIFQDNFEGDLSGWFFDGGYAGDGGEPDVTVHPPLWEFSQVKAKSPTHSLFHPDEFEVSRSFAVSPPFTIPTTLGGDPVVAAKVSFQVNIHNPGWQDPTQPGYLGDYFMVYAGIEDTQFQVVDVEGNKMFYSGYPEENSFQFLTTPLIDLSAAEAPVELSFKYLMINERHWDLGRVDILVDGEPGYNTVAVLDSTEGISDMTIDLSSFVGKSIAVRFAFLPDDATIVEDGGLWLDDIKVADANGVLFADDAEAGMATMNAFGVSLARLFYDYDRVRDGGAAWTLWNESVIFNGTADIMKLGIPAGSKVFLAFRYIADGDNTQGEETSVCSSTTFPLLRSQGFRRMRR